MLALLKLIPLKDWLYGGIIIAILSLFGWYTVHERNIGKADVHAVDAKLAAKQDAYNKLLESTELETVNVIAQKYQAAITAPIPDSPHVVCVIPRPDILPQASAGPGSIDVAPDLSISDSVDIGPPLDTVGRDADAQVTALQDIIKAQQALSNGTP